jgi:hypothetical protein
MENDEDREDPTRLYIERPDKEKYDSLLGKDGVFAGKDNKDVFIMAMVIGYSRGVRVELVRKEGYVRFEYLKDRDKSIMKSIAVADRGTLDVLLNKKMVYSIAEEYAAGGIKLLVDMVFGGSYGSFEKRLESELVEEFERIKGKEAYE